MKNFKPFFVESSFARSRPTPSNPFFLCSQRKFAASDSVSQDEGRVIDYSYGLNLALAGKGVIVKDQAFLNLNSSQLQHKGATIAGILFITLSV
ncbi:unnamed protein product [Prunus brigantina]